MDQQISDQINTQIKELKEYINSIRPVIEKIYDEYTNNYGSSRIQEVSRYFMSPLGHSKRPCNGFGYIHDHLNYIRIQNYEILTKMKDIEKLADSSNNSKEVESIKNIQISLDRVDKKTWSFLDKSLITNEMVSNSARKSLALYKLLE